MSSSIGQMMRQYDSQKKNFKFHKTLLETESNHSSEKDLQSPAFPEANKLLHDSDSNLHKIILSLAVVSLLSS
jgi:hypothetical protein